MKQRVTDYFNKQGPSIDSEQRAVENTIEMEESSAKRILQQRTTVRQSSRLIQSKKSKKFECHFQQSPLQTYSWLEYETSSGLMYCKTCKDMKKERALTFEHCVLVFDLQNVTSHQLHLEYADSKTLVIEPTQCRRTAIEIPRVDFPPQEVSSEPTPRVPNLYRQCRPVNHYSKTISNYVDVRWSILSTKVSGKLSIDHLTWTNKQLSLLEESPVVWEIRLNSQLYMSANVPKFSVGEVLDVAVSLINKRGGEEENVTLQIEPVQVSGDSMNVCQETSVLGGNSLSVKKVCQADAVHHSCAFVFHSPGCYRFSVVGYRRRNVSEHLKDTDLPSNKVLDGSAKLSKNELRSVPETDNAEGIETNIQYSHTRQISDTKDSSHIIWRCLPQPEIQIIE